MSKYDKGSLGYLRELANNYGSEYGPEFIKWARQNKILVNPTKINRDIWKKTVENAGCKTLKEYRDRFSHLELEDNSDIISIGKLLELAKKDGFDNINDWNEYKKAKIDGFYSVLEWKEWKNKKTDNILEYNPCSKKYQDKVKELRLTGNQYMQKLINEGKLPDPTEIDRKYLNDIYIRRNNENPDRHILPISENKDCTAYLGVHIAERKIARIILPIVLGNIKNQMPYGNPGFDFIVEEKERDVRVDIKSGRLGDNKWDFAIKNNDIADYFLLIGFNNKYDSILKCLRTWLLYKNDIIRGRKFYARKTFGISNVYKYLLPFKKYELTDKLQNDIENINLIINLLENDGI